MRRIFDFIAILISLTCSPLHGAELTELGPGDYDPDFGDQRLRTGIAYTRVDWFIFGDRIAVDSQDRIYLLSTDRSPPAGEPSTAEITRYLPGGEPDASFSTITFQIPRTNNMQRAAAYMLVDTADQLWLTYARPVADAAGDRVATVLGRYDDTGASNMPEEVMDPGLPGAVWQPVGMEIGANGAIYLGRVAGEITPIGVGNRKRFDLLRFNHSSAFNESVIDVSADADIDYLYLRSMDIDASDRVVLTAGFDPVGYPTPLIEKIYRFNTNGGLDGSFGASGSVDLKAAITATAGWGAMPDHGNVQIISMAALNSDDILVTARVCCTNATYHVGWKRVLLQFGVGGTVQVLSGEDWLALVPPGVGYGSDFPDMPIAENSLGEVTISLPNNAVYLKPGAAGAPLQLDTRYDGTGYSQPGNEQYVREVSQHSSWLMDDGRLLQAGNLSADRAAISRRLGHGETRDVDISPNPFDIPDLTIAATASNCVLLKPVQLSGSDTAVLPALTDLGAPGTAPNVHHYWWLDGVWHGGVGGRLVPPDAVIQLFVCSMGEPGTTRHLQIDIGGTTDAFTVAKLPESSPLTDNLPDRLFLPPIVDATPGDVITLGPFDVTGIEVAAQFHVGWDTAQTHFSTDGELFSPFMPVHPGEQLWIRVQAPEEANKTVLSLFAAGGYGYTETGLSGQGFTITTGPANVPSTLDIPDVEANPGESVVLGPFAIANVTPVEGELGISVAEGDQTDTLVGTDGENFFSVVQVGLGDQIWVKATASEIGGESRVGRLYVAEASSIEEFVITTEDSEGGNEAPQAIPSGGGLVSPWFLAILAGFLGVRGRRQSRHFH